MACLWANSIPMPWLPTRFEDRPGDNVVDILVIGESSAQGVPYDRWFSVADIVAWKLRAAFPQMTFQVENQATPGLSLQAMHTKLAGIKRRPELVILYAGHNEFQSRFDWAHGALHYADETSAGRGDAPEPGPPRFSAVAADGGNRRSDCGSQRRRRGTSRGNWLTFRSTRQNNTPNDSRSFGPAWGRSFLIWSGSGRRSSW